ncbi:MAG: Arylsulfotransferase, partial [Actinomycetia bacterium]|nr:Arylsulfotransferase [Actinomycetes bacterium]
MTGAPSGDRPSAGRGRPRHGRGSRWRPPVVLVPVLLFSLSGLTRAADAASTTTTKPSGNVTTPAALPQPRPSRFDASGTVSMFPAPGTRTASPTTTITLRGAGAAALAAIQVTGAMSGAHPGHFQPQADGMGTGFVPDAAFTPGEKVTVRAGLAVRGATNGESTFTVARPTTFPTGAASTTASSPKSASTDDLLHFVTRPDLTPPALKVTTPAKNTAPGDVFLTPANGDSQHGPLIVDNQGQPVWALPVLNASVFNLQVQQYRGQPVLTWFQGPVVDPGVGQGGDVIADASYHQIAIVRAVNGYAADIHDMTITPQGTALLIIYNPVIVDASSVGGAKNQHVLEPVVQEIDIATGALLFEWHGLGSIALKESYVPVPKSATATYDYVHPNSVTLDQDGDLLLSGRYTWAVHKIDRVSATLDWRLGGKLGNFAMPTSAEPAWQHDARRNPDGTLSVFDDGAGPTVTHKSRGLVLTVDEQAMTATLDHQYLPPKPIQSSSQGSTRLLANGDWFVGWGNLPEYTEYAPDGTVVYDVHFP